MNAPRRVRGFTLIELMVSLAITASLLLLGMPAYRGWVQGARIKSVAEGVHAGLQKARAEAIRRNAPVTLRLVPDSAGGASWSLLAAASTLTDTAATATSLVDGVSAGLGERVPVQVLVSSQTSSPGSPGTAPVPVDFTFGGLGQLTSTTTMRRIDFVSVLPDVDKRYAILLSTAGGPRLCNPGVTRAANVQGCL